MNRSKATRALRLTSSFHLIACAVPLAACAEAAATDETGEAIEARATAGWPGATEPAAICRPSSGQFTANVTNPYFPLEVCSRKVLSGIDDGVEAAVRITVLDETRMVDGVRNRVVEEYHTEDGELVELSYNFFAQTVGGGIPVGGTVPRDGSVCYFGETVDIFNPDGTVTHEGAWLAGQDGAQPGIVMPSKARKGQAYKQEVAPGLAMDRAWHTKLVDQVLHVTEDTPLEPGHFSFKRYRRGTGLIFDAPAKIVSYEILDPDDCERADDDDDDDDGDD